MKALLGILLLSTISTSFAMSITPNHVPTYGDRHDNLGMEKATDCAARRAGEALGIETDANGNPVFSIKG